MVATRAGHASNALGKAEQKRRQAESRPNLLCRRFAVAKMEKEKKEMSKKNNRINVPEAREAGSVGGQMVKKMIESYEKSL